MGIYSVKGFQNKKKKCVECFSPRANVNTIEVKAGDLDGNEALQYEAEGHLGPHLDDLAEGDLGGNGDQRPILDNDWEGFDAEQVKSERLRTVVCKKGPMIRQEVKLWRIHRTSHAHKPKHNLRPADSFIKSPPHSLCDPEAKSGWILID